MTSSDNKRLIAALEANWQAEMEGHYTYTAFAKDEVDPQRRNALRGLAAAEKPASCSTSRASPKSHSKTSGLSPMSRCDMGHQHRCFATFTVITL